MFLSFEFPLRIWRSVYISSEECRALPDNNIDIFVFIEVNELHMLIEELNDQVGFAGQVLIRQLKRRDKLTLRRERQYDIITAYLQAAYVQEHIGTYISVLYTF